MGKMAASLAHQIRTPLAGALLYLSQCRTRRDDAQRGVLLEKGIERLRHLDRLVQDMLVFARGTGPGERVRVAELFRAVHDAALAVKPANAHLVIDGTDVLVELDVQSHGAHRSAHESRHERVRILAGGRRALCALGGAAAASSSRFMTTVPALPRAFSRGCSSRSSRRARPARALGSRS